MTISRRGGRDQAAPGPANAAGSSGPGTAAGNAPARSVRRATPQSAGRSREIPGGLLGQVGLPDDQQLHEVEIRPQDQQALQQASPGRRVRDGATGPARTVDRMVMDRANNPLSAA